MNKLLHLAFSEWVVTALDIILSLKYKLDTVTTVLWPVWATSFLKDVNKYLHLSHHMFATLNIVLSVLRERQFTELELYSATTKKVLNLKFVCRRTSVTSSPRSNSSWSMNWYKRNPQGSHLVSHCLILMITQFWTSKRQPRRSRQHFRMTVLMKFASVSSTLKRISSCHQV